MSEAVFVTDAASSILQSSRDRPESGFYCSTSGANITNRDDLAEHYKSDFHRYNLKRKVAGLPPVTKEWFEARRAQLVSSQTLAAQAVAPGHTQVWFDPLLRKTFRTEQTFLAHTRSHKYQEAVRKSGQPAPPAIISVREVAEPNEQQSVDVNKAAPRAGQVQATPGFMVVLPSGGLPLKTEDGDHTTPAPMEEEEEEEDGWETASDEDLAEGQAEGQDLPEWNPCRSLFDNHISRSFEENLERMWKLYGFYLPDAQYLTDPEGLVKYLGAKLQVGRVPLYTRGDDPNAKQFRSLHAVQRHMVDSGRCKIIYEDNEEEYEEFYNYDDTEEEEDTAGKELVVGGTAPAPAAVVAGELVVPGTGGAGAGKVLGTRDYARYYRQKHRTKDERLIVTVNVIQAKYRALGISLRDEAVDIETKKLKSKNTNDQKWEGKKNNLLFMRGNINRNLPKNVPY